MSLEEKTPTHNPDNTEKPSIPGIPEKTTKEIEPVPPTIKGQLAELLRAIRNKDDSSRDFLLRVVQPGLAGLMDGSVSTLAPIFATAFATHNSTTTFLVGMASATGAGISMAFSEGLSDRWRTHRAWQPCYSRRHHRNHDLLWRLTTHIAIPDLQHTYSIACRVCRSRFRTGVNCRHSPPLFRDELVHFNPASRRRRSARLCSRLYLWQCLNKRGRICGCFARERFVLSC